MTETPVFCQVTEPEMPRPNRPRRHLTGRSHICVDPAEHNAIQHRCFCGHLWDA